MAGQREKRKGSERTGQTEPLAPSNGQFASADGRAAFRTGFPSAVRRLVLDQ